MQQPKRRHDEPEAAAATTSESSKRVRRSRWESGEDAADAGNGSAKTEATPPPAAANKNASALSDIVKRLSSVVKEKSVLRPPAATAVPTISTAPQDASSSAASAAAAARARALAQASLLAMGLQPTHVSPVDLAKRVYVGNLNYDLKDDVVRHFFAPFGTIGSVDLTMEPGTGRSKGFCFIEYEDVVAAESAVQVLNGSQLSNRSLKVGRPHRGNSADAIAAQNIGKEAIKNIQTKCVYVGCVRTELNSHHLQSIFSPFGEVRACVMAASSLLEPTQHRGFGFLEFADEASASNAIQHMNGFELAGQKLQVGKASASAMAINLAMSQDKVVHQAFASGASSTAAPASGGGAPAPPSAVVDEMRCLCLVNMVSKGDVDEELQDEVQEECSRFGKVESVHIHELHDHVRVFVVFADAKGAAVAKQRMNGRFFGGNQVRAGLYPLAELQSHRYESAFT